MTPKPLPQTLTSYDLLKALAIILMIIDHVGLYILDNDSWCRVIGRLSMPVWFFLIGYANTREVPRIFLIGGALMVLSTMAAGETLLPLNILFTLALTRVIIDRVMAGALKNHEALAGMFFILFFLAIPSAIVLEYGTLGVMFAMLGWMRRHEGRLTLSSTAMAVFILGIAGSYIVFQSILLVALSTAQLYVFTFGMLVLITLFFLFRPHVFAVRIVPLQLLGRRTLEIYVIHMILFKAAAMVLNPAEYGLFAFDLLPPAAMMIFDP